MTQQMNLIDYKKRAWDYLKQRYNNTTKAIEEESMEKSFQYLGMKTDKDWEEYINVFSPEELIQGLIAGLL